MPDNIIYTHLASNVIRTSANKFQTPHPSIINITQPIRLSVWKIFANWHSLFPSMLHHLLYQTFHIGILHRKMKQTGFEWLKLWFLLCTFLKLKIFNSNTFVFCQKIHNTERSLAFPKYIFTHFPDSSFVFFNHFSWYHY